MIYHFLDFLQAQQIMYVNPMQYITVRAAVALAFSLLTSIYFGPMLIAALHRLKAGQPFRTTTLKDAPDLSKMHAAKKGVPTMGGILILGTLLGTVLLFCNLLNPFTWLLILVAAGFGMLGFLDDYLKITKRNSDGLSPRYKMIGQVVLGLFVGAYLYLFGMTSVAPVTYVYYEAVGGMQGPFNGYGHILVPFFKWAYPAIGAYFILYAMAVLVGSSNAVNLTDGLDGLCIGITTLVTLSFMVVAYLVSNKNHATYLMLPYVSRADEVVVFLGALTGASLGFLWFNAHPADMFMGDTGSMALGGILGTVALITKQELLLGIIGGIFVIETLSVVIQVGSMRLRNRRVFLMSPIHHHYERKGVPESKIIIRFWIVTALLALIGLASMKIR